MQYTTAHFDNGFRIYMVNKLKGRGKYMSEKKFKWNSQIKVSLSGMLLSGTILIGGAYAASDNDCS